MLPRLHHHCLLLSVSLTGFGQDVLVRETPGTNDKKIPCPKPLLAVLPKTNQMLKRVKAEAAKIGLAGWPELSNVLAYPIFDDPKFDRVWSPQIALWNVSPDGKRFDAILLMKELNPSPRPYPSDLEYFETVFLHDAFGKAKLSKIGIRIHSLYRNSLDLRPPTGFPRGFGLGNIWAFEDVHDEGGASSHFVFTPSLGLAFSGYILETQAEHLAPHSVDEPEEMGDSGGHADECAGTFVENLAIVRESNGYLWLKSETKLFAFDVAVVSNSHRSILNSKKPFSPSRTP